MKKTSLILSVLYTGLLFSQSTLTDSLRQAYEAATDHIIKADLYYQWAEEVTENDLDEAFMLADTLEELAQKNKNNLGLARAEFLRADAYRQKGNYQEALHHFQTDLNYRMLSKDSLGLAKTYSNIAAVYKDRAMADSSIHFHLLSLQINKARNEWKNMAASYANIGNLYGDLALHDRALEYLQKALKIRLDHGDEKGAIYTYNNISIAYEAKADYATALDHAEKGAALALKYGNKFAAGVIQGSMCHLLNKLGRNNEALISCEKSFALLDELNRPANAVYPLVNLAMVYNDLDQPHQALQYAQKGYAIMQRLNLIDPMQVYYDEFAEAYEKLGNYKESIQWLKKYTVLTDSLFNAENIKNVAELETRYQTQKKETELAQQKLQLQTQDHRIYRQRMFIVILLVGLILFTALGLLYTQRLRLRKKMELDAAIIREQKMGLKAVIEAQEAERSRMAKELHDGVAQELVAAKMGLQRLQLLQTNRTEKETQTLESLINLVDESCQEVRAISHEMLPPVLVKEGLLPSLKSLLQKSLHNSGVEFIFESPELPPVNQKVSLSIYRIAQELINNILKHSGASQVSMAITVSGPMLEMKVVDNGRGFSLDEHNQHEGLGLWSIFSRVGDLGGTFKNEPNQPSGTISTLSIPLP